MLQSVFGTLKLHDFDSPDYLQTAEENNNNTHSNNTAADKSDFVKDKPLTHGERYKNALVMTTTLDNGAYLRLAPFNVNYLQDVEEKDTEEMHIHENYTNR